eukprot:523569-Alexandrium_andersonii.AAC.1
MVGEIVRGEAIGSSSSLAPKRGTSGVSAPGCAARAASASAARPRAPRRGTPVTASARASALTWSVRPASAVASL